MNRRSFIKKTALATAGTFVAPYILPSGRLFAASGARKANHVVFCMFAGGVRNIEAIQKAEGNLMPYTLTGTEPINPGIIGGMSTIPAPSGTRLQNFGTLFKEFRYNSGPTGHFNGHTAAITGIYTTTDLNLKENPQFPTVFEYYRKHNSPTNSALNAWWISNSLGPYPALNYSRDTNYGALYGANYIQPASIISQGGYDVLGNPKTFTAGQQANVKSMRTFFDNNFANQYNPQDTGVVNPDSDAAQLESFINTSFQQAIAGQYTNPWGLGYMSNDMFNIFFAEKIIQQFKPELLVVNMQDVDIGHSNFTQYCNNMRKADYSLWHLWNTIQATPGMANDTILIAVPEHGRNQQSNSLIDAYGRYALDHTNDATSREIFCLILGPSGVVVQNQQISSITGQSIDVVPTIATILGFYDAIPGYYKSNMGSHLSQAFI